MKKYTANHDIDKYEHIIESDNQVVTHLKLDKGQEIPTHSSNTTVLVIIYKGKVDFTAGDETIEIIPGDVIKMEPGEDHSLKALEDSDLMVVKSKLI